MAREDKNGNLVYPNNLNQAAYLVIAVNALYGAMIFHECDDCEYIQELEYFQTRLTNLVISTCKQIRDEHYPIEIDVITAVDERVRYTLENGYNFLTKE